MEKFSEWGVWGNGRDQCSSWEIRRSNEILSKKRGKMAASKAVICDRMNDLNKPYWLNLLGWTIYLTITKDSRMLLVRTGMEYEHYKLNICSSFNITKKLIWKNAEC